MDPFASFFDVLWKCMESNRGSSTFVPVGTTVGGTTHHHRGWAFGNLFGEDGFSTENWFENIVTILFNKLFNKIAENTNLLVVRIQFGARHVLLNDGCRGGRR